MSGTVPTPGPEPTRHRGATRGQLTAVVAVVALLVVVLVLVVRANRTTSGSGSARSSAPAPTGTGSVAPPSSSTPTSPTPSPTRSTTSGVPLLDQGYVPLYPFAGLADAQAWQQAYRSGGHQPWHLDAGETALSFTRGYLGFTEIDRVVGSVRTAADGAHVDVGYLNPAGRAAVAATLHLMRFGAGSDAPWEVVGSDDTTFTLDVPRYGSTVSSPVRVGGLISGVDENIVVSARQLQREAPLATAPGVPAGGEREPWTVTLAYAAATAGPMTLVASTGGHVQRVERFAITGVRAG